MRSPLANRREVSRGQGYPGEGWRPSRLPVSSAYCHSVSPASPVRNKSVEQTGQMAEKSAEQTKKVRGEERKRTARWNTKEGRASVGQMTLPSKLKDEDDLDLGLNFEYLANCDLSPTTGTGHMNRSVSKNSMEQKGPNKLNLHWSAKQMQKPTYYNIYSSIEELQDHLYRLESSVESSGPIRHGKRPGEEENNGAKRSRCNSFGKSHHRGKPLAEKQNVRI